MHKHEALILWERKDQTFVDNKYSRAHLWELDGVTVPASSSPAVLPVPLSSLEAIDPEEALVAATSSCHMLFFLAIAAKRGFVVDRYSDQAYGVMGKNSEGKDPHVQNCASTQNRVFRQQTTQRCRNR